MAKIHVGVLRGGPSSEYEVSLKTGGSVLRHLSPEKYRTHDILITKDGVWHLNGIEKKPEDLLKHLDVVFNAMHGEYGEDGKVQQFLESHQIPFTGSNSFPSAVAMNKEMAKNWLKKHGLKTPIHTSVRKGEDLHEAAVRLYKTFPQPSIIKPVAAGSSVGIKIAHSVHELQEALEEALQYSHAALIEEFIKGREATCGVIENWRDHDIYALMPIEIIKPSSSAFFDYKAKYGGETQEICPGNFTSEETKKLQEMAIEAHKILDLRHYSRSDFIVHPKRGIYILEVNTQPGLTEESLFPKAVHAIGSTLSDFLDHLIHLALGKK